MKNDKKIELLAPAGSPDAFYGAVAAGADAVYLAGNRFGARAYADNFTEEELTEAIRYAHLFGVKVYLTVNTLFKNKEMEQLADYIRPYYEEGLDGVIVQDLGVLAYLKEHFPILERHISTQMTVTSLEGARFLVDNGASRVVPARELTMEELKILCEDGIEVESFIHGSMCYCYSGQCLFSSLIGGRSGNRGRCAQPCRLPYGYKGSSEEYFFSLKDMCTLNYLPQIIDSGIASLKIEGRMKNPAYAAGVTAVYRKYIDLYYANPSNYSVAKSDLDLLHRLYIRTEIQEGYYRKKRGADMITLRSPGYSKTDDILMEELQKKYVQNRKRLPVDVTVEMRVGYPIRITASTVSAGVDYTVTEVGECVMEAIKAPLNKEDVCKRIEKSGDTFFAIHVSNAIIDDNVFLPVGAINEIRRRTLGILYHKILQTQKEYQFKYKKIFDGKTETWHAMKVFGNSFYDKLRVFIDTKEQFEEILQNNLVKNIVLPLRLLQDVSVNEAISTAKNLSFYLRLPAICRKESFEQITQSLESLVDLDKIKGFYVNQVDSMAFIRKKYADKEVCGDVNLYGMNDLAVRELLNTLSSYTISLELNAEELKHMDLSFGELLLYGRYPLMNTANCIFLTHGECHIKNGAAFTMITDRKGSQLPVRGYCDEAVCYNTVYNSVPTSLHKQVKLIEQMDIGGYQIRFVEENKKKVREILSLYHEVYVNGKEIPDPFQYTNGHFKRKVE